MSVVYLVTFKAKDEAFDKFRDFLKKILPDTAAYPGAEFISCAENAEDKSFLLYEVWDSAESQASYIAWRGESGDAEAIGSMLREAPEFKPLNHVPF